MEEVDFIKKKIILITICVVIFSLIGYFAFCFIEKSTPTYNIEQSETTFRLSTYTPPKSKTYFKWAVGNTDLLFLEHYCGQLLNNIFLPDQSNMDYSFKVSSASKSKVVDFYVAKYRNENIINVDKYLIKIDTNKIAGITKENIDKTKDQYLNNKESMQILIDGCNKTK